MASHTKDIPVLSVQTKTIEARHYNRVRLALIRLKRPLRFKLLGCEKSPTSLLGGSWDLVSRVIGKVTTVIITYNPN